jgi:hypothetical protein
MTEFKTPSQPQYTKWIESSPQTELPPESNWLALNHNRRVLLKDLLAPYKEAVCEAAINLRLHLEKIDQALSTFMQLRQHAVDLITDYSGVFTQLRLPPQLQTATAQMLLDEYAQLVIDSEAPKANDQVAGAVRALNELAADLEQPMQVELASRARLADHALQEVLSLINDTHTLANLRQLLDTDSKSVGTVFTELLTALEKLGVTLQTSQLNEPLIERTIDCLSEIQGTFTKLSNAIAGYNSPNGEITSAQLRIRDLKGVVKQLSQQLPPASFQQDTQRANHLSTLTSAEKRATLIVLRHLDTLTETPDVIDDSIRNAQIERDQLILEMLRLNDAQELYNHVIKQADCFAAQYPHLITSLESAINEAKSVVEDKMLSIVCEHSLDEDIASYIVRQQLPSETQGSVVAVLLENQELSSVCSRIIKRHHAIPIGSVDELRRYLDTLNDVLSNAKSLSPLVLESLLAEPNRELATQAGLTRSAAMLKSLKDNPAQLLAYEHAYLESKITTILETSFSELYKSHEKRVEAARILFFNFVPESRDGTSASVVREGKTIISRYKRFIGSDLKADQLQNAISRLVNADILVLSNRNETDPGKRRYHISKQSTPALIELTTCLESMASRTTPINKQTPPRTSPSATQQTRARAAQSAPSKNTKSISSPLAHPTEDLVKIKIATFNRLLTFIDEKLAEFEEKIILAATSSPLAQQSQAKLSSISILSSRLLSSVAKESTIIGASKFREPFEFKCFKKLSERVGVRPIGTQARSRRPALKKITERAVQDLVVETLIETSEHGPLFVLSGRELFSFLEIIQKEIGSNYICKTGIDTGDCLEAIKRCMPLDSSDTGKFAKYCELAANQSILENARDALKQLRDKAQISVTELSGAGPDSTNGNLSITTPSQQEAQDE